MEQRGISQPNRGQKKNYDFQGKIILLGESTVGKTSILEKFSNGRFSQFQTLTIGVDFRTIEHKSQDGKNIQLKIWDTSGQERFRSIAESFYKGSHGVCLVFDLNNRESFDKIQFWVNSIYEKSEKNNIVKVVIGNKSDLEQQVQDYEIQQLCQNNHIQFFKTSAKMGLGLDSLFDYMANKTFEVFGEEYTEKIRQQQLDQQNTNNNMQLGQNGNSNKQSNQKKSCC